MTLAADEPVTDKAVVTALASRFSKFVTVMESPLVWSLPATTLKSTADTLVPAVRIECVGTGAAVDRCLGTVDRDGVVAAAGGDDVGAAAAIDDVGTGAARDGVRRRRSQHRDRLGRVQRGRVDVLESADGGQIAQRLIGRRQIDGRGRVHHQRVAAGAAVDRDFAAPEVDGIVAGAGIDDVGTAATMDRIVAGAGGDGIAAPPSP